MSARASDRGGSFESLILTFAIDIDRDDELGSNRRKISDVVQCNSTIHDHDLVIFPASP